MIAWIVVAHPVTKQAESQRWEHQHDHVSSWLRISLCTALGRRNRKAYIPISVWSLRKTPRRNISDP
jgi:hypothetical protein